jgi:hypothetical protein
MWVAQKKWLYNLRHAAELGLDGTTILIGFVDGTKGWLEFASEEEAKRFWQLLVLRLGRLDGVLMAEGVADAGQG